MSDSNWLNRLVRFTVAPWGLDPSECLRAQVVATLHLLNLGSSVLASLLALLDPSIAERFVPLAMAFAAWNLAMYFLARTRWYRVAAIALVLLLPVSVTVMALELSQPAPFFVACAWLAIGIGVSSFLLPVRVTVLVLGYYLLVPPLLAPLVNVPLLDTIGLEVFLLASAMVVLLHNWVIRATEHRVTAQQMAMERSEHQAQRLQAIGQLAGGVAHDFNNLLLGISGTAELALMKLQDGEADVHDDLKTIVTTTERAADLTRQLLAFGTRQVLNLVPMDVNLIVQELSVLVRRVIGEHVELRLMLGEELPAARADRHQLEQVIMNLVLNARDAMPDGGTISIETAAVWLDPEQVATRPEVKPGRYVQLSVTDSGGGITDEVRQHLFEPFFTTKEKGTGLGLATVYGIVKQHQGHITVYSTSELGTTFKVYIPIAEGVASEVVKSNAVVSVVGGNERLLVVEDGDAPRHALVAALARLGYRVFEAKDGQHALERLAASDEAIDLLLTDIVMPRMSGRELSEKVRQRFPNVSVVFMSGYTEDTVVQRGIVSGEATFLQKPFSIEALSSAIRVALGR